MMKNKQALITHLQQGNKVKYLLFCAHHKAKNGAVDKNYLSQWYSSSFQLDGHWYQTSEHYMMAQKAKLFNAEPIFKKIITSKSPKEAKQLGREVAGFNRDTWDNHKFDLVVKGNLAKFSQSKALRDFLLDTGKKVLVEASPSDTIWGIGLKETDPRAQKPSTWLGQNLLGFALMQVREQLKK
ncbi:NADAR family protein [Paraglaciecola sp. 2405UD69-4]|uniref:NADAR family protein n=1 Tax=Paraglaciecola sp. 2405UD69-4 TaxID=3391836 RepID=UPI0039C9D5D1